MDFKTLLGNELTAQSSSAFSLYAIKEYLSSTKDKLTAWLSGEYNATVITLSKQMDDGLEQCFALTSTQYQQVLDGVVDSVNVQINELGETITLSSEEILECIQDVGDEIATQGNFLDYCLENETVSATSFLTNACSTIRNVSRSMVEKYSTLLSSGNAIDAIQSFFATSKIGQMVNSPDTQAGYIGVLRASDYSGISIWRSTFIQLGNIVTTTLTNVGKAIWGMGTIFGAIGQGLYDLSHSLLKTLLAKYYTRFETTLAPIGIVDIPLMQLKLGTLVRDANGVIQSKLQYDTNDSSILINGIQDRTYWESWNRYNTDDYVLCGGKFHWGLRAKDALDAICSFFGYEQLDYHQSIVNSEWSHVIFQEIIDTVDGVQYPRSIDYFVPSYGDTTSGIVLRLGVTEDDEVILQVFPFLSKSAVKAADHDVDIFVMMSNCLEDALRFLGSQGYPTMVYMPNNAGANSYAWCLSNVGLENFPIFFTPVGTEQDNYDVIAHCRFFTPSVGSLDGPWDMNGQTSNDQKRQNFVAISYIHFGLFGFIIRNSKFFKEMNSVEPDYTTADCGFLYRGNQWYLYHWVPLTGVATDFNEAVPTDYDILPSIINSFFPYLQRGLTKTCIHYQTIAEVGQEFAHGIIVLAIAAAAVYVGVKWSKFARKMKYKMEIAQGNADSMSWEIGDHPTASDLKNYHKAKKKAKFYSNICSSLGITSSQSESSSVFDLALSIKDQLSSQTGIKEEYNEGEEPQQVTNVDVKALIQQTQELTDTVRGLVLQVKNLINSN